MVRDTNLREHKDHQEERGVAGTEIVAGHEHDEAGEGDRNRGNEEPEPLLESIGQMRMQQTVANLRFISILSRVKEK